MGALIALEQTGMKDAVVVASVDAIADALQAVKVGRLDATVFQDAEAQGATAVETAVKIVKRESFSREVYIPFRLITPGPGSDAELGGQAVEGRSTGLCAGHRLTAISC